MADKAASIRNEPHVVFDVVAAARELLTGGPGRPVRPIPPERTMPDPRLRAERLIEQSLPAERITRERHIVEQQKVPPKMCRVARRPDQQEPLPLLDDPV